MRITKALRKENSAWFKDNHTSITYFYVYHFLPSSPGNDNQELEAWSANDNVKTLHPSSNEGNIDQIWQKSSIVAHYDCDSFC